MTTYHYDGTPDGFFCALARWAAEGADPSSCVSAAGQDGGLFSEAVTVESCGELADQAVAALKTRFGLEALQKLLIIFMSDENGREEAAVAYLAAIEKNGLYTVNNQALPAVRTAEKIIRRVLFEGHRLKGLVRFRLLADGTFYAPLEPDHLVLPLLLPHFHKRFGTQKWIIHDVKRNLAACHDQGRAEIMPLEAHEGLIDRESGEINPAALHHEELAVQELWKVFYNAIAIQERVNPRLQKGLMPRRYWKYLVEKPGSSQALKG